MSPTGVLIPGRPVGPRGRWARRPGSVAIAAHGAHVRGAACDLIEGVPSMSGPGPAMTVAVRLAVRHGSAKAIPSGSASDGER
jgi:hypothetical protein